MTGKELFQYTGKVLDESTGLYYEGARYYDPTTGRFTTEDSYSGTETDPITRNRYVYGADDPMRHVDPTGHMSVASSTFGGVITMVEVVPTSTTITQVVKVVPQSPAAQNPNSPSTVFNQASMQQQMNLAEVSGTAYYGGVAGSGSLPSSIPEIGSEASISLTNEQKAYAVVGLFGTVATVSGAVSIILLTMPPPVDSGAVVSGFVFIYASAATVSSAEYVHESGPNATPSGAFLHGLEGVFCLWSGFC